MAVRRAVAVLWMLKRASIFSTKCSTVSFAIPHASCAPINCSCYHPWTMCTLCTTARSLSTAPSRTLRHARPTVTISPPCCWRTQPLMLVANQRASQRPRQQVSRRVRRRVHECNALCLLAAELATNPCPPWGVVAPRHVSTPIQRGRRSWRRRSELWARWRGMCGQGMHGRHRCVRVPRSCCSTRQAWVLPLEPRLASMDRLVGGQKGLRRSHPCLRGARLSVLQPMFSHLIVLSSSELFACPLLDPHRVDAELPR